MPTNCKTQYTQCKNQGTGWGPTTETLGVYPYHLGGVGPSRPRVENSETQLNKFKNDVSELRREDDPTGG